MSANSSDCRYCGDHVNEANISLSSMNASRGWGSANNSSDPNNVWVFHSPPFEPTPRHSNSDRMSSSSSDANSMNMLAAIFFAVAGTWLIVALVYSLSVLLFLRMRSRGELENMYDEGFGRVYLWGSADSSANGDRSCYIPMGCIFRRYMAHMQGDIAAAQAAAAAGGAKKVRYMTTEERRRAMEILLGSSSPNATATENKQVPADSSAIHNPTKDESSAPSCEKKTATIALGGPPELVEEVESSESSSEDDDIYGEGEEGDDELDDGINIYDLENQSVEGPLCSICLGDYETEDQDNSDPNCGASGGVLQSKTCTHCFHKDCILDWLQRHGTTDCPCCRTAMVSEDDVWKVVKSLRREKRRAIRREKRRQAKLAGDADPPELSEHSETAPETSLAEEDPVVITEAASSSSMSLDTLQHQHHHAVAVSWTLPSFRLHQPNGQGEDRNEQHNSHQRMASPGRLR